MTTFTCEHCNGRGWIVTPDGGAGTAAPCACRAATSHRERLGACGVWPKYLDCTRQAWKGAWPAAHLSRFCKDFFTLTILGPTGAGKTHLGVAILGEAVAHGGQGTWRDCREVIEALKESFSDRGTADELDQLKKAAFLVLDDLGQEIAGAWLGSALSHVLSYRDGHLLPTIITSNISSLAVLDALEPRLASRLAAGVIHLSAPDRRSAHHRARRAGAPDLLEAKEGVPTRAK
jgi:chromosomal replication initiation ATPase DnaA